MFRKHYFIIGLIIIFLSALLWLWSNGTLKYVYYLLDEFINPSKQMIYVSTDEPVKLIDILEHKTSLKDLGIIWNKESGDSADLFFDMLGTKNKSGTWHEKYGDIPEEEINLDKDDISNILNIARREEFSLYPNMPMSYRFGFPDAEIFPGNLFKSITKLSVKAAKKMNADGEIDKAEELLGSIIIISRRMEGASKNFNTEIAWLIGLSAEKDAAQGLKSIYEENNDLAKVEMMDNYLKEIEALKETLSGSLRSSGEIYTASFILFMETSHPAFARAGLRQLGIDRKKMQLQLKELQGIISPVIQLEALSNLAILRNSFYDEPEKYLAEAVLKQYTKSDNPYVSIYAQNILDMSREDLVGALKMQSNDY